MLLGCEGGAGAQPGAVGHHRSKVEGPVAVEMDGHPFPLTPSGHQRRDGAVLQHRGLFAPAERHARHLPTLGGG